MNRWISFPRREGVASRQAHTNLPPGTFEREFGKEGFFGPVTQMYHAHPPTGWTDWSGALRPRAFDLTRPSLKVTVRIPRLNSNAVSEPDTRPAPPPRSHPARRACRWPRPSRSLLRSAPSGW